MVADAAYAACLELARRHYENFPVASRLLPPESRPHIAAIYAFARTADDFADEGERTNDARLALLDDWGRRLREAGAGRVVQDGSEAATIFTALAETMRVCRLEIDLFEDLISAFRQDVVVSRYETWTDVMDYCRRSANPVGRLVLRVAGYRDPALDAASDAFCSALQLTNFWQDLSVDWTRGRLYVPADVVRACGAVESDLDRRVMSPAWRRVIDEVALYTRELFRKGRAVADAVGGRLRWELRATWHGGVRILDRVQSPRVNVLRDRPALGWRDAVPIGVGTLTWR